MKDSKIEWTDHTFNPWWGCAKVSPACAKCYAEAFAKRTGHAVWSDRDGKGERRTFGEKHWREPLKWNAEAASKSTSARVFCASMADVFEDHAVANRERSRLWGLIAETPYLDWLLLTKRPQNIRDMLPSSWGDGWRNVWLGTTVENQRMAEERIPHLKQTPAAVRFLSCEPLLGPVDLGSTKGLPVCREADVVCEVFQPHAPNITRPGRGWVRHCGWGPHVDWVIVGGESGPGARPMHPDWARSLRDQCQAAGVAFHFKQWGEWAPDCLCASKESHKTTPRPEPGKPGVMFRCGKKAAGRLLDGRTWDEFPGRMEVTA